MLTNLHIQNFALIQDANIEFEEGFSVITGETGAGKSIMLDALALMLGKRADASILSNTGAKCVIEGEFKVEDYELASFFEQQEMEYDSLTIIRREIGKNGKSRAFVNDSPVVLSVLKKLGEKLIDVHSQNANALLDSRWFYYDLLDGVAGIIKERTAFELAYKEYQKKKEELKSIQSSNQLAEQELAFKQFQLNELKSAQIKEGEQEQLEKDLLVLSNAEEIKGKVNEICEIIRDSQGSVLEQLSGAKQNLNALLNMGSDFAALSDRLNSVYIELEDIHGDVDALNQEIEVNPEKLQEADERLGTLFSLVKKFSVLDSDGLLAKQQELASQVDSVLGGDQAVEELKKELTKLEAGLMKKALAISKKRFAASKHLKSDILKDLLSMNMKNSQLEIQVEAGELNSFGCDKIDFLFSANKGGGMSSLRKVASGGEFSRIMLSLKRILSAKKKLPTILFDEIDTGVSGEVADKMAGIMDEMSQDMQVIAITHLPQIASKGSCHYKVIKEDVNEVTQSHIKKLAPDNRVQEVAQMLSGSKVSPAAVENAKELLSGNLA